MSAQPRHSAPTLRVPLVKRRELLRGLKVVLHDEGPQIVLLSAPAGFGKTTLVTQFSSAAAANGVPVAWADLEFVGNSPRAMWHAILAALASLSTSSAEALRGLRRDRRRVDDRFFEKLQDALSELPRPSLLVLDDLQVLSGSTAASQLSLLVRRLPESVRLIMASRHDPEFSLHDLRLGGRLVELRAKDLAFTPAETTQVLSRSGLDADDIAAVTELTEGWPAGVQLARVLLKQPGDGRRLAALFNSESGLLADYLFQEAFTSQDAASQDLLLRTAIASEISDGLATALTGRSDAGEAIADMVDLAPLLSRYGDTETDEVRYRYHPLLRSYLVSELARRDQELLRATHRSAATWYARHDAHLDAITHAKASEDTELLDAYLERYGAALINIGESDRLLHVLARAPLAPTAWEAVVGACAALRCQHLTTAARWLAHPHQRGQPENARLAWLRSSVTLKLACLSQPTELPDVPDSDAGPHSDDELELLIALNRSSALLSVGETAVESELKNALDLASMLGRPAAEVQARVLLAAAALGDGDFVTTRARVEAARTRVVELDDVDDSSLGLLEVVAAWVAYEDLDDPSGQRHLDAWRAEDGHAMEASVASTALRLADLLQHIVTPEPREHGDVGSYLVEDVLTVLPAPLQVMALSTALRTTLDIGRPDLVRQALDRASSVLGRSGDVVTMQALVLTAQHRDDLASQILEPVITAQNGCRAPASLVEALMLATTHAVHAEHPYEAFSYLKRAIVAARECGGYRHLALAPPEVHAFMAERAERLSEHRQVVEKVLSYANTTTQRHRQISPLTDRELDILRELQTLNPVDEIADNLLISTNTVKTHIRGVYRKLGVRSRKDAVAVARRRGIL
ncbi:MAG TPA: LuxR C-terminal-related transcriptional regulator [Nocardioidaceae bacterium]|nr:LuxR C-terminal-related transcriptional regulator [Nocardioidaceae bacterium]